MIKNINNGMKENEKDALTHLSFKQHFGNDWRKYFEEQNTVQKVLNASGLSSSHDFVQINSRYLIDDNRVSVIALIKRKNTEILDKLIIDIISGLPQFEQLMDVLYNVGSDCDYRVVLYDYNAQNYDYDPVIGDLLTSLMDELRECVFLTVMAIDLEVSKTREITFHCLDIESVIKNDEREELPDRRYFEEAEFWTRYFIPAHRSYSMEFHEYDFGGSGYEEDGGECMSSYARWDDAGMIIKYGIKNGDLKWLLTNEMEEMESFFKGCSIEFSIEECNVRINTMNEVNGDSIERRIEERVVKNKKDMSLNDILSELSNENNVSNKECSITICRPIPFRNFIYSSPEERRTLTEEYASYATAILSFESLLQNE